MRETSQVLSDKGDMKDELFGNKIFGAILGALLLLFGLRQVSEMVFTNHPPKVAGDKITIQEAAGAAGEVADTPPDWGTVLPTADINAGATVANKCKACHNLDNGGPNQTGPNLWGVIGRKPGTHPGFAYSSAMTDFGNKIGKWDYQHVYEFLSGPQAYLSGTKMSFVGLKQRQDRINLIGWLRQQSSSPEAIPAPNPKAAPAAKAPAVAAAGTSPAPAAGSGVPTTDQAAGAKAPATAAPAAPK
ncbi:MAG: cytochrome c family protein [Caulobacteraceae bacterium]